MNGSKALAFAATSVVLLSASVASAFTVRSDRPRILFGNGSGPGVTVATFKTRCTGGDAKYTRCAGSLSSATTAAPLAASYVVSGDASKCSAAFDAVMSVTGDTPGSPDPHSFISNNGGHMQLMAEVRDWCDAALSDTQKNQLETRMVAWADWYLGTYPPGDVFHDDMNNVWSSVAFAGLALKGTAQDAKASEYLSKADTQWKNVIFPAMAYVGDWWHEGFVYNLPTLGSLASYAAAWSTATDDDIFSWAKTNAKDLFEGYFAFYTYAMRPDFNYVYFGDTTDNKQSIELFSRPLIDTMQMGARSPLGQGLSKLIADSSRPFYDYSGDNGWMIALLWDASLDATATDIKTLPTARWLSKGANDIAVLRSGWTKDDTYVWMSCGDYFGAHGHDEAGAFQIFRHSILSGSDGYYDNFDTDHWANYYSQHSVHANTLAVYDPTEIFPTSQTLSGGKSVNDGGQRPLRRLKDGSAFGNPDLPTYMKNKTSGSYYETGDMKTFEAAKCHDYVACDVTMAYDSKLVTTNGNKAKVNEVTRQFVFLPPEILVIFDRVESTDASYEKRFLLHSASATPDVKGNVVTITNGTGRLIAQTLLPKGAKENVLTNFTVEGTPHPPSTTGNESGGTRIEVVPSTPATRDYFLHVLDATDPSKTSGPTANVTETDKDATVTIDDGKNTYVVLFDKTGAMGGHITVTPKGATTATCDQPLGADAEPPPGDAGTGSDAGVDGGSIGDASIGGDGGPTNGDAGTGSSGGCGCRAAGGEGRYAWIGVGVLIGACVRRSRRRAGAGAGA